MKILLIEDDAAHLQLISYHVREILKHELSVTRTLAAGKFLLDWCEMILLDLNLPDSIGLETLERIQRLTPKPIVIISSDAESKKEALERGAMDFIVKGEFFEDIERTIKLVSSKMLDNESPPPK